MENVQSILRISLERKEALKKEIGDSSIQSIIEKALFLNYKSNYHLVLFIKLICNKQISVKECKEEVELYLLRREYKSRDLNNEDLHLLPENIVNDVQKLKSS